MLVTGADRGIGAACARALALDGWRLGLVYRTGADAAHALAAELGDALAVEADLTDPASCDAAFERVTSELGPVLGLVNNAGVRADNLALSIGDEDWERVLAINLTAAFRLTRRALRPMLRARFGRIINVASVVGPRANPGQANYAASKAGLIGMTRTIAAEVARRDVTVNAVAPGFIETDMTADIADAVKEAVPARRAGRPEEVAACVAFLASDEAGYVTGTTLYVDGGLAA
jgi:3-oxoacyl-[acyl-carrier protein] reductase